MTPTPDYSWLIVSNPFVDAVDAALSMLVRYWWAFALVVALLILFMAHRTLLTRYGTDPRWKLTSQEDQLLEYEKEEHPALEPDDELPTSHWRI